MKKYLFIVLLVGVCFGQDVYPYFSDMSKQLEFEKKKIIIEEGESTQQIITGGGSEFNPWSLVFDFEPTYKIAPIKTRYRYNSYFNIQRDGKDISEIEMLRVIGLNQEADIIIKKFENVLKEYHAIKPDTTIDAKYYKKKNWAFWLLLASPFAIESGKNDDAPEVVIAGYLAIINYVVNIFDKKSNYYIIKKSTPVLQQQLNAAQTKSMAEAYNRKLYTEIAKK